MTPGRDTSPLYRASIERMESGALFSAPPWLTERRQSAGAWFKAHGFPSPKDEAWRFTAIRDVLAVPYQAPPSALTGVPTAARPFFDAVRVRIENGRPEQTRETFEGVRVLRLASATSEELETIEPYLARLSAQQDGFAAQNTALFEDAVVVVAERGKTGAVHLEFASGFAETPTVSFPRVLVLCEEHAELSLLETHTHRGPAANLENSVIEIALASSSRLEHVRLSGGRARDYSVARVSARLTRDCFYGARVFTLGGELARLDLSVSLDGPGAECELDGLYIAQSGDHLDHHTTVDHTSAHATSRERFKGILDGSGYAVFDGTVFVRRGAQRTVAHQENRNLLLGDEASVHAKPHLEIDADDVKCSHGTTVGRLDEDQLFYLRSRGLDLATARAALTYSFAGEVLETIKNEKIRRHVSEQVLSALPDGARATEVA